MKSVATNETVEQTRELGESLLDIVRDGEMEMRCAIHPVLGLEQGASCDEEQPPSIGGRAPTKCFRDVGADRATRTEQLDPDRPLISLAPRRHLRAVEVREVSRAAIGDDIPMSTRRHALERSGAAESRASTCHLPPATC